MEQRYRIGVLTAYTDGEYYGRIIESVHRVIAERQAQMIVVQTHPEFSTAKPFEHPVFLDHADGWLIIMGSAAGRHLPVLRETDKPTVFVGMHQSAMNGHSVYNDNRGGMKQAVLHLIDHGHRDIAFVGSNVHHDVQQRYLGYCDALAERGIPIRSELHAAVKDNLVSGGIEGAMRLLEKGAPFTAAAAGTDLNAMGFIHTLEDHGLRVPQDVAVVGFDDIDQADSPALSLTTTKQHVDEMAVRAADILLAMLDGERSRQEATVLPVELVRRASCGCTPEETGAALTVEHYKQKFTELQLAMDRLTHHQFELIRGMVRATTDESFHISKLFWNMNHWGCFALLETDLHGNRHFVVHQAFAREGDPVPAIGERYPVEAFPPVDKLPEAAGFGGQDALIIRPVVSENREWGVVALAGPTHRMFINNESDVARNNYRLLVAALEREALHHRIRLIADQLVIVSNSTNDVVWNWDLVRNKVEWNARVRELFGMTADQLTEDPETFYQLLHPEDASAFKCALEAHLEHNRPFRLEFRIRTGQDSFAWLSASGEAIRGEDGAPLRMVGSFTDITMKKTDEEKIARLSSQDALTGLPNRLYYQDQLETALAARKDDRALAAVVLLDLDRFKTINEMMGHHLGDRLLQVVADKLRASLPETDLVARIGGDEFGILLHSCHTASDVLRQVERILELFQDPVRLENRDLYVSASIGVSLFPDHGSAATELIKKADIAMYEAKENGRNQAELYRSGMGARAERRFDLETHLRRALERKEFELHFQPQIDNRTGMLYGVEALIRWRTDEQGIVSPADFIPLAEETGLIVPLGTWVLREACRRGKQLMDAGFGSFVVSVNISAQQFQLRHFAQLVKSIVQETGLAPACLCLEITETTAIRNIDHSIQTLRELVEWGVKVAIDDFGTGHSSLILLKRLPIHHVKIDKSFVRDMEEDEDNGTIVKAVIAMSHSLGLSVTAEGVETREQLERLRAWACDFTQGYYYSKPLPAEDLAAYLGKLQAAVAAERQEP